MNDKKREIDDFQPHVKKAKLESENYIQNSCDTFIVEKHLLLKHLNHLSYLKIKQEKREQKMIKKKRIFAKDKIKNRSVSMTGKS